MWDSELLDLSTVRATELVRTLKLMRAVQHSTGFSPVYRKQIQQEMKSLCDAQVQSLLRLTSQLETTGAP